MDRTSLAYWEARALHWKIAPPLSPGAADVAFYERSATQAASARKPGLEALLLGVTKPIATMRWPPATRLVALDWARGMFRHNWPRERVPAGSACLRGDWREMPLAGASRDLAIGDGCFSTFTRLDDARLMVGELHRVLRPGGLFAIRSFCRPDAPLELDALFSALLAGELRNLGLFRWLLAMSLHGNTTEGVSLHAVWRAWHARVPEPGRYREALGWDGDAIAALERWRDLDSRYSFPSRGELLALVGTHFAVAASETPDYEWGQLFPRLLLRRG